MLRQDDNHVLDINASLHGLLDKLCSHVTLVVPELFLDSRQCIECIQDQLRLGNLFDRLAHDLDANCLDHPRAQLDSFLLRLRLLIRVLFEIILERVELVKKREYSTVERHASVCGSERARH